MKRFRVIVELEATDSDEACNIAYAFTEDGRVKEWKLQRIYGKRKPKPNPNQLDLTGVYESAKKMQDKIDNLTLES